METDRPRDPLAATTTPVPRGPVPPLHELPRVGSTQDEAAARLSGGVGVPFAVLAAEQTAAERLAQIVADQIVARLGLFATRAGAR